MDHEPILWLVVVVVVVVGQSARLMEILVHVSSPAVFFCIVSAPSRAPFASVPITINGAETMTRITQWAPRDLRPKEELRSIDRSID